MNPLSLDIRTVIHLLVVGNLTIVGLLLSHSEGSLRIRAYRFFLAAKVLQALGWLLLGLRGGISDLVSVHAGNAILFAGLALEALALITARGPDRRWERACMGLTLVGILGFLAFAHRPGLRVVLSSLEACPLVGMAAIYLLSRTRESRLNLVVGVACLLFSLSLLFRAMASLASPGFTLLAGGPVQAFTFLSVFVLVLVGGIGFLLMLKEQGDRLLAESEDKYRTLVEQARESILILQDLRIVFANSRACDLLSAPLEALREAEILAFIHPEDRDLVRASWNESIQGSTGQDTRDFRCLGIDQRETWVTLSAARIQWKGRPATLALLTDITARKRLEAEQEKTIAQLQKAFSEIRTLSGLLPICSCCKKVRDDRGYWNQIESYIAQRTAAEFTHGICPDCRDRLYPREGMRTHRS